MSGFNIALNGLRVAQEGILLAGLNIANAGAEGYHRQELHLVPMDYKTGAGQVTFLGPDLQRVRRMVDQLLESEIVRQHTFTGQFDQELVTLQFIESALGEVGSDGMSTALSHFFNSLTELAAEPDAPALQEQVIWAGDSLALQMRNLSSFFATLKETMRTEIGTVLGTINNLSQEIAELNAQVAAVGLQGGNTNLLKDQQQRAINELAQLIDITVRFTDVSLGVIAVESQGTPLVIGNSITELESGLLADGQIGISIKDANLYSTDSHAGKIGGLLSLYNETVSEIQTDLDLLAGQIIEKINRIHVQGVGASGSFEQLIGTPVSSGTLENWDANLQSGKFYIRLIDTDGVATVYDVDVDITTDTVTTIRDALNALDVAHLSAEVAASTLRIEGLAGWKFDFIPSLDVDTTAVTGTAVPTISGIYSGETSDTFTFTVVGTGDVSTADDLTIEVRNGANELVKTLNVGLGYAADPDTPLDIGYGIKVSISSGTLNNGDEFTIEAIADSDETGFLAAAGINTFFSGDSALTIAVRDRVKDNPDLLATMRGTEGTDNQNILRLAELGEAGNSTLGGVSIGGFYRQIVSGIGQVASMRGARQKAQEQILQQLENRRSEISGVDMNEEAAKLLIFQQMFQAMSHFLRIQNDVLQMLMKAT